MEDDVERKRTDRDINQIKKIREWSKWRKQLRNSIAEVLRGRERGRDPRPYATIKIGEMEIIGLLDSGATVSLLGKGCRQLAEKMGWPIQKYYSNIRTASGQSQRILGKVIVEVEYNKKRANVTLYLCPDLEQELYLGIDFWEALDIYDIAPKNSQS